MKFTIRGLDFIVGEIKSTKVVLIVIAALSPFIIFMFVIFYDAFSTPHDIRLCNIEKKYRNHESIGVISKIDEGNFNYHRLTYESGEEYVIPNSVLEPKQNALHIGDTVRKQIGSLLINIHPINSHKRIELSLDKGCKEN